MSRTLQRLLWEALPNIRLTLLVGRQGQAYDLGKRRRPSLTETVRAWRDCLPDYVPLPHPSQSNIYFFERRPWFDRDVVPAVRVGAEKQFKLPEERV